MPRPARKDVPLATQTSRSTKKARGATSTAATPLNIRTSGPHVSDPTREHIAARLGRQLGKFALNVERVTVRFRDINGPRGGVDQACRIKVVISGLPSVIAEERAEEERKAFDLAAAVCERTARRALERAAGRVSPKRSKDEARSAVPSQASSNAAEPRTLIGRRVGRAEKNLNAAADRPEKRRRDFPVDTASAGVSATDRKAGAGSTARRNTKRNTAGMTSTLEDSLQDRPSRKSTRRSANRTKQGTALQHRQVTANAAPAARAARASASKRGSAKR